MIVVSQMKTPTNLTLERVLHLALPGFTDGVIILQVHSFNITMSRTQVGMGGLKKKKKGGERSTYDSY